MRSRSVSDAPRTIPPGVEMRTSVMKSLTISQNGMLHLQYGT
ncbi:hypothetical protein BH23GEM6_BH23GEM6_26490 [soil metagenome]